ncbi:MAG: RdgB/HAM1 family non-canonical purine NTP pyrophosphatase [Chitinophagaceae bacterium]
MKKIIFATNNQHKVDEIKAVVGNKFQIITLHEAGIDIDIEEPHDTLDANATEKSTTIFQLVKENVFSEDTGLEVLAINNEPGVKSARYAGDNRDFTANTQLLLSKLANITDRRAQFRTVISLIFEGKEYLFEGICKGTISNEPFGNKGFGYDPVFIPDGSNITFAQMNMEEKNVFSHRKKATNLLLEFLQNQS